MLRPLIARIAGAPALWRACLAIAFATSILNAGMLGSAVPELVWYAAQFGPLLVAAGAIVATRPPQRPALWLALLGALVVWSALSAIWSVAPGRSIAQAALFAIAAVFLAATVLGRWNVDATRTADLVFGYVLVQASLAAGGILLLVAPSAAIGRFGLFQGVYTNPNAAAIVAAVATSLGVWLAVVLRGRWRVAVIAALPLSIATLVASDSRGPIIAAALGVIIVLVFSPHRRVSLGVLAVSVAAAVTVALVAPGAFAAFLDRSDRGYDVTSGRWEIWQRLLGVWAEHPLVGIGYRTVEVLPGSGGQTAHNVYLSVLVETGIVGALLFVALLVVVAITGFRRSRPEHRALFGVTATVLVIELTQASLFGFGGPTALLCWLAILAFVKPSTPPAAV